MSYTSRERYQYKYVFPSDDILAFDDSEHNHDTLTYVKQVEFTLKNKINPNSIFKIYCQIKAEHAGTTAYVDWRHNNNSVGEYSNVGTAWTPKTANIALDLKVNDTIEIYTKTDTVNSDVYVKEVRLQGFTSLFEQTV